MSANNIQESCVNLGAKIIKLLEEQKVNTQNASLEIIEPSDWSVGFFLPISCGRESRINRIMTAILLECSVKEEFLVYLGKKEGFYFWYFTHPETPSEIVERMNAEIANIKPGEKSEHNNPLVSLPQPTKSSKSDTVFLALKEKYFNAIENGAKKTEYRELNQYYADKILGREEKIKFVKLQLGYGGKGHKFPKQMVFEVIDVVLVDDFGKEFPAYISNRITQTSDLPAGFNPTMYGLKLGNQVEN